MTLSINEISVLEKIKNRIRFIFKSNFKKNKPIIIISNHFNQTFFDELRHALDIIAFQYNSNILSTIDHSLNLNSDEIDDYSIVFNLNIKMNLNNDIMSMLNKPVPNFYKKQHLKKIIKN